MNRDRRSLPHQFVEVLTGISLLGWLLQLGLWIDSGCRHWLGGGTCWLSFILCVSALAIIREVREAGQRRQRLRFAAEGPEPEGREQPSLARSPGARKDRATAVDEKSDR